MELVHEDAADAEDEEPTRIMTGKDERGFDTADARELALEERERLRDEHRERRAHEHPGREVLDAVERRRLALDACVEGRLRRVAAVAVHGAALALITYASTCCRSAPTLVALFFKF